MSSEYQPADAAALDELRTHLGLYPEMPRVERVHLPTPIHADPRDRTIALCIHDGENGCAHVAWFPAPNGPSDLLDEDGEIRADVQVHCEQYLCAAYN